MKKSQVAETKREVKCTERLERIIIITTIIMVIIRTLKIIATQIY